MMKHKRKRLTPLEIRCIRKFYLTDGSLIGECASSYFKSLGVEKCFEVILKLAQEEPIVMKVEAKSEDDFTIYFDDEGNGNFEEIFVMEHGIKVM